MKNWIRNTSLILATISIAALSSAQQNPRYMTTEVIREAQRVQELITREADYLTIRQLDLVKDKLLEIREIIRNGGNPYPNPPTYPPQYGTTSIRGDIEMIPYSFDVNDLQSLHSQCTTFIKSKNLNSVDEIRISVNLGPITDLKNSASYWKGANQVCQQIINVAKNNGVRPSYSNQHTVYGSIEAQEFKFVGYDKSDMFRQCEQFLNSNNLRSVDEIIRVTNFGTERELKNSSSYWKGSLEICQQVLAEIR